MFKRYIELCGNDVKYSIAGLVCGCFGSYYNVIANEQTDDSNDAWRFHERPIIFIILYELYLDDCDIITRWAFCVFAEVDESQTALYHLPKTFTSAIEVLRNRTCQFAIGTGE